MQHKQCVNLQLYNVRSHTRVHRPNALRSVYLSHFRHLKFVQNRRTSSAYTLTFKRVDKWTLSKGQRKGTALEILPAQEETQMGGLGGSDLFCRYTDKRDYRKSVKGKVLLHSKMTMPLFYDLT